MFYLITILLLIYIAYVASREGGGVALRKSFLVAAVLAPMWMTYNVRSIRLDFRIIQALLAIACLVAIPPRFPLKFRPVLADAALLGLVATLCVSQYLCGALAPLTPFDIAASWLPSYVVGRIFFQSVDDLRRLAPFVIRLFAVVAVLAVFEAITAINPVNAVLGKTFGILESGEGYRWGMKRAQGNLSHPIYNGYQLILLLPLVIAATVSRWHERRTLITFLILPAVGTAVFVTVSRGAHIGFLIAVVGTMLLLLRRARLPVILAIAFAASSLYSVRHELVDLLESAVGQEREEERIIMIDGEPVVYTGTKHRILLLQVYRVPLERTGWFGWGGSMNGVRIDPELEQRFGSIDSHYVLFTLQYGHLGIGLFLVLGCSSVVPLIRVAWKRGPWQPIAAAIVASMAAIAVCLSSVWFAPDYAAVWLFVAGLASNVRTVARSRQKTTSAVDNVIRRPAFRRLVPVTQISGALAS